FEERPSLAVVDLAFISLTLVWPAIVPLLRDQAVVLPLVKPQFEVGKGQVGQGGVVRSAAQQRAALVKVAVAAEACGLMTRGMIASPLLGPKGNREFFLFLQRGNACCEPAETVLARCWSAHLTEQGAG
ncbi:MAG: SAM-dependent methyltransferase, partial [Candidatus Methylomirabilales bacterium]